MTIRHKIQVINGHIVPANLYQFRAMLQNAEHKWMWLTLESDQKPGSDPQRRYYFGCIVKVQSDHWGYVKDEVHIINKEKFLRVPGEDGKPDRILGYSSLTTEARELFHENIRMWMAVDFGVSIPLPNEIGEIKDEDLIY